MAVFGAVVVAFQHFPGTVRGDPANIIGVGDWRDVIHFRLALAKIRRSSET
jgi:hypothetical protein